jgi:hypothetical protein
MATNLVCIPHVPIIGGLNFTQIQCGIFDPQIIAFVFLEFLNVASKFFLGEPQPPSVNTAIRATHAPICPEYVSLASI